MFINISNHPMEKWLPEQMEAAKKEYGTNSFGDEERFVNLEFPKVDPNGDEGYIENLACNWMIKIHNFYRTYRETIKTVHLMGESGFCARLGKKLRKIDATVIHSTTERIVEEDSETGEKKSVFKFVRFRRTY